MGAMLSAMQSKKQELAPMGRSYGSILPFA